jgi:AsmA protein
MKKPGKFLGILAVILVISVLLLIALAKIFITPERVREAVLPLAQDALHRKVQLGDIEVRLFSGIVLKDLVIQEREGDEPFVAADQVVLRYQFWPLLFMRVIIDEARLDSPRIRVTRLTNGSFNFSDLMENKEKKVAVPEGSVPAKAEGKAGIPIDLLVSEVEIANGELVFVDQKISPEAPYRYKLTGLDVNARDISLKKAFPFSLKAQLNQSSLGVEGEANLETLHGKVKVLLSDFDVMAFNPYFRNQVPGKLGSLKMNLDLTAEGDSKAVASRGTIALKQIDLALDAMKDMPIHDTNLALDYDIKANLAASMLDIDETTINFNGVPVHVSGHVENYAAKPVVDITVKLSDLELRPALAAVPKELVKSVEGMDLAGTVNAQIHLAGSVEDPMNLLREGEVHLAGVQGNAGGIRPVLNGRFLVEGDSLTSEKLKLRIGDNEADVDVQVANFLGEPIVVSSLISAERFHLDPLLKATAAPVAVTVQNQNEKAEAAASKELGPFDLPLKAEGGVRLGQALYKGLTIENFDMHYQLENNILTVDKLTGNVAGGTFVDTARVDLNKKGLAYTTQLALKDIQADPVLTAFMPRAGGTVFGTLDLNAQINGEGTLPEAVQKNLSGKGDLLLTDGKLTGAGLVQGLADYLDLEELRVLRFSQAKGSFTVQDGKLNVASDFSGSDVRLFPQGKVGLDGSLDVALDARLSPELTRKLDSKGEFTRFLTDEEGWGQIPIKVGGTVGSPQFVFDTTAIKGKVKEKAREEIQKKLEEKLFEKLGPSEEEGETQKPTKKLLEDTLQELFGH